MLWADPAGAAATGWKLWEESVTVARENIQIRATLIPHAAGRCQGTFTAGLLVPVRNLCLKGTQTERGNSQSQIKIKTLKMWSPNWPWGRNHYWLSTTTLSSPK
ncbi:hypothetical protein ATANTOWER_012560 [Ataeniobius toweri]|uniref:Uncharacterized protein n=1 Tax=Ataeniobius toweri TaxID=208326 RepID=A0ABU7AGZ4_9TELE|nr:hypothetical protein [Ataeniobius toweri]